MVSPDRPDYEMRLLHPFPFHVFKSSNVLHWKGPSHCMPVVRRARPDIGLRSPVVHLHILLPYLRSSASSRSSSSLIIMQAVRSQNATIRWHIIHRYLQSIHIPPSLPYHLLIKEITRRATNVFFPFPAVTPSAGCSSSSMAVSSDLFFDRSR